MNPGGIIGAANRERVRNFLATHIGATNRECAKALGLGEMAVGRHVKALRAEWAHPEISRLNEQVRG